MQISDDLASILREIQPLIFLKEVTKPYTTIAMRSAYLFSTLAIMATSVSADFFGLLGATFTFNSGESKHSLMPGLH